MQSSTTAFKNALKRAYSASTTPTATLEWNLNRFGTVLTTGSGETKKVTGLTNNGVAPTEDDPVFPLSSIIEADRPTSAGIIKGWTSPGVLGQEAKTSKNTNIPTRKRVYTATPDAKYKYWISPNISDQYQTNGSYPLANCVPTVQYQYLLRSNKLVAQFENSGANPVDVIIQITVDGTNWTNAGGSYTPDALGRIELYLQDNGTWSTTKNLNNVLPIRGIRARVTRMNKPRVHAHVIEIAIMREINITSDTMEFGFDYNNSEASFVAPLGKAETSTGSITLSNIAGRFDNDRPGADLYGLMNSPAKVRVTGVTTAGGQSVTTTFGTMYVETWGEQTEDTRRLSLSDASMLLKSKHPPATLLEGATGTEIIWRLLDSVGFVDFSVDESPFGDMKVKYYWTDPEKTVWEHIQEISEGLQIACYFDEFGILRIKTREKAYEADKSTVDWTFDGQMVTTAVGTAHNRTADVGKVTDIIEISKPHDLEANKVTVEYTKTEISAINKFQPKMEQVWEPEGTVSLRTANLAGTMANTAVSAPFSGSDFATWPYEGYIQMNGEVMKWTKKRYKYLSENGVWNVKYISDDAEKDVLDSLNDKRSHYNKFDGWLYFGTKGRGLMSTVPRTHTTGHDFSAIRNRHKNGTINTNGWYTRYDPKNSVFKIQTTKAFSGESFVNARRGTPSQAPPRYIGTSLKFDNTSAYSQGSAGIYIGGQSYEAGYYIEVSLTSWAGKRRSFTNEVSLYVRGENGKLTRIGKGAVAGIAKGQWYDLDVYQRDIGGTFRLSILLNGQSVMVRDIPSSAVLDKTMPGHYGVFARGHTHVDFEYLYAANSTEEVPFGGDDSSRWDLIEGGFRSNYYNNYLYKAKMNERLTWWSSSRVSKNTGFSFDEFGAKAHEIREFKVEFEPAPVVHSRLYLSNEWYADCLEYTATHNSAKFLVSGKGRDNVILNGEDTLLYGADNVVEQKMFVYGRTVTAGEVEKYEVQNDKSIRRTGEVELTISSPWIQSEPAAKKIGDWVAAHWSNGSEKIEIESFGNPLIQVGDVASVCYLRKSMFPAQHEYYVTGVSHSYTEGLETTVRLQRKSNLVT